MLEAIDRRDVAYVLRILDPAIKNSFGGDGGIEEFKQAWKPESPDSELWTELRFVLAHGGAFQEGNFVAPYFFSSFPDLHDVPGYDEDSFRYGAVIGDVRVLDGLGREVLHINAPAATITIDCAGWEPGSYVVHCGDARQRIIVLH